MTAPGISYTAWLKLGTLRHDYLAMSESERLEFVESLRARRRSGKPTPKAPKQPKSPKVKVVKPKKAVPDANA